MVWQACTQQWVPLAEQVAGLVSRLPEPARAEIMDFARFLSVRAARPGQNQLPIMLRQEKSSRRNLP